ncbi:MAG TPA: hypothetical protein VFT66_27490 [Roseiflexaceae bacterium]|nr:hypothetical protein [Roseiflexaceae bacterium]
MVRPADGVCCRSFRGSGGDSEHYLVVDAPPDRDLQTQLVCLAGRYREALESLRLPPESAVFRRLFVSDVANQTAQIRQTELYTPGDGNPVAVSLVQQPPANGSKIAMLAYHRHGRSPLRKRALGPHHVLVESNALGHLWSTRLCAHDDKGPGSAVRQTHVIFDELVDVLGANGATLAEHCVRTWIFVKDADVFYQDMVAARSALFARHGLTRDTHYLASTGIEGACTHRYDLVFMDAYSILGLMPAQMSYLNDFGQLLRHQGL